MQVEAFLSVSIDRETEFLDLYYKYAKVKAEVNKMKEEQEKIAQRRQGLMSSR